MDIALGGAQEALQGMQVQAVNKSRAGRHTAWGLVEALKMRHTLRVRRRRRPADRARWGLLLALQGGSGRLDRRPGRR